MPITKDESKAWIKRAKELRKEESDLADKLERAESIAQRKARDDKAKAEKKWLKGEFRTAKKSRAHRLKVMKTWSRNYGTTRCIKIDLLAPGRDEELMRRNNPVKHAVWIAGFCVIAVLIWMLKLRQDIRSSRADFTAAESQFMGIKNKFELVKDTQGRADEVEHKIAELDRLVTNRFLWAPLLNTVENIKVEGIHFTRISGDQQYTYEGSRSVVGPHWVETFTPAAMVESVRLSIEARDQSADQHALIQYRNSLNKCSYILKDLNCPECFTLDATLTPAAAGASNQTGRFMVFDLVARFPEVRRNE